MQKLVWQNANGETIDLTSGFYGITEWEGFSNASLNIQSQQVPFQDGAVFLDALIEPRELSVTLKMQDNNDLELRYQLRRELIHKLNPKLGEGYLIYTNDFISKRIKCVAQIPLFETHNSNDSGTPKASLSWVANEPYWEDLEENNVYFKMGETPIINNEGDVPAQVEIEFYTQNVENPIIENITTGKFIKYDGILNKNLHIDTNYGKKKVYENEYNIDVQSLKGILVDIVWVEELLLYIACSGTGFLYKSYDGKEWEYITVDNNTYLNSITYSKKLNMFVAVGFGIILYSFDTINWYKIEDVTEEDLTGVCYSEDLELFVAVGYHQILNSTDGINWTVVKTYEGLNASNPYDVIYSPEKNIFISVGSGMIYNLFTSTDGINWTDRVIENSTILLKAIIYNSNLELFIAVGDNGKIYYSSNGTSFSASSTGITNNLTSVSFNDNITVAVGSNGTLLTSTDGINWTDRSENMLVTNPNIVIYNDLNNCFITAGAGIANSDNGINWELTTDNITVIYNKIVYSKKLKLWIIVGNSGYIATSEDKKEWTQRVSNTSYNLLDVIYNNDYFITVGQNGIVLTSVDGINWVQNASGTTIQLNSITYCEKLGLYFIVGNSGKILKSSNLQTWIESTISTRDLQKIYYCEEYEELYILGYHIYKSYDGENWETISIGRSMYDIVYSKIEKMFIISAVSQTSQGNSQYGILASYDGTNWFDITYPSLQEESIFNIFYSIAYSKELNVFMIGCQRGQILLSNNGIDWIITNAKAVIAIKDIYYDTENQLFVLVGSTNYISFAEYKAEVNKIQNISSDSDIGFNLEIGNNRLRLIRTLGDFSCNVKYRQKYIGV